MITARFAGEHGRSILAVPGRIDQANSAGCHQLIRDGAVMVTSVDDILEELRYERMQIPVVDLEQKPETTEPGLSTLSGAEQTVLDYFSGGELVTPDLLAERLACPVAEVSGILMSLELKHRIVKRVDGRFEAK